MAVKVVRLLTGEEILGDVVESDSPEFVRVNNPTHITAMPNPKTGNMDIHMAPFLPLCKEKFVDLAASHVLCQYEPVKDIANKHVQMHSGIIMPGDSMGSSGLLQP
jgi:hypothetical protein